MRSTTSRATVSPSTANPRSAYAAVRRPLAGAALVAAGLLLAGCSVGQIAETARKNPSVPGANADRQLTDANGLVGSVSVRDVLVAYQDPKGYRRGGDAPLDARVFNDTTGPMTVRVTVARPGTGSGVDSPQVVEAGSVSLVGGATPGVSPGTSPGASPSGLTASGPAVGNPSPDVPNAGPGASGPAAASGSPAASAGAGSAGPDGSAGAGTPATFDIPAGGMVVLSRAAGRYLLLTGLRDHLTPGESVPLVFRFSNGRQTAELFVTAPMANPLSPPQRATPDAGEAGGGH